MNLLELIKKNQLSMMLFMSGICFILVILTLLTKSLTGKRRRILVLIELGAMLLLVFDRQAYIYRGDTSTLGYWMVRISNFLVYFISLYLPHAVNLYLFDLYRNEGRLEKIPVRLWVNEFVFTIGLVMLIVSQFTGLYYTFDENNLYQRSDFSVISYIFPFLIIIIQLTVIVQYRKKLSHLISFSLILNNVVPLVAAVIQFFAYGISLVNLTIVGMAVLLYVFALVDLNISVENAKKREIEFYKEEQEKMETMLEETSEALATAIDAKDVYTHGHSSRVADYSRMIAERAGLPEDECDRIFLAGLLHDVGKIGINDSIINKPGKLTDEEFEEIKSHPVKGNLILSNIHQAPFLSEGAHYHHERYDGKGYPEGISGEDIPRLARIIAVADAYDAMTSKRSYRNPLPQEVVREELVKGTGTQFDPEFSNIMIAIVDEDKEYKLCES